MPHWWYPKNKDKYVYSATDMVVDISPLVKDYRVLEKHINQIKKFRGKL